MGIIETESFKSLNMIFLCNISRFRKDGSIEKTEAGKLIKKHCQVRLEKFKVPSQFIFKWEHFVNDRFKKVRTP